MMDQTVMGDGLGGAAADRPSEATLCAGRDLPRPGLDQMLHALQAKATMGISPIGPGLAVLDWAAHLANSPTAWQTLQRAAAVAGVRWLTAAVDPGAPAIRPGPEDHRFAHPGWQTPPFNLLAQGFLLAEAWMAQAAAAAPGVAAENARIVAYGLRQAMDVGSPSNVPWLNPEVLAAAAATRGRNFIDGWENFLADLPPGRGAPKDDALVVGRDLAVTAGRVVFRNGLIELIQYAPRTAQVRAEPVLIVPAWIMKYYILDLSPKNSLIDYLVGQGFTVFAISWKNPVRQDWDVGLDDYRVAGVMAALAAISGICGGAQVHACGYCLGGTLLSIAAAAMARDGDARLASMTLLAAQTDFSEAGELQLFINEDQLAFLSDVMAVQGYLDSSQMSGAFQMLRSNDLVWSRAIRRYMLGEKSFPNDLMVWNADGTRMPARMHAEYLRHLFLQNDLAEGRLCAGGAPVAMGDIKAPCFAVGTAGDHIAPWHSVYKIHLLHEGDVEFVLTSGGHNAGIVSEPGHLGRHFRRLARGKGGLYLPPEAWLEKAEAVEGSWWPAWAAWLAARSSREVAPPVLAEGLCAAPGSYVLAR